MKTKKIVIFCTMAFLAFGCGKSNKAKPSAGNRSQSNPAAPGYTPSGPSNAEVSRYFSENPCQSGEHRLTSLQYNSSNISYQRAIYNLSQGHRGGNIVKSYLGRSRFGDIIVVDEMSTGGIPSYNITISYCSYEQNITEQALPQNFREGQGGIIIGLRPGSAAGKVNAAYTVAQSYGQYGAFQVSTTFVE